MVRIKSLDMFGGFSESKNGQYLLVLQDSDRKRGIGGYRDSGNGKFALVNSGHVVFAGECERPIEGEVANNGTFAITDTLFGDKLGSKLYTYSADGVLQLSHEFSANTLNIGISIEGSHVVAQLCSSDTEDSGKLYLFDSCQSKVIVSFIPETGWADKYEFSISEEIVYLCYKNNRRYRYLFDGTFLDSQCYDRERVEDASPTGLIIIVREKLREATNEQLPNLLSVINRAFEGNLSEHHDYEAIAYRLKGEIQEALGEAEQAILAYRKALSINPKVGVKQRLKKLEKANRPKGSPNHVEQCKKKISRVAESIPVSADLVQEVIYNFTQYAFIGGSIKGEPLNAKYFPKIFNILQAGQLTQIDLAALPLPLQRVLYELLTQYVMFLSMNPALLFPPGFLDQSNAKTLSSQVTAYMAEHEWPFPQMLQQ